MTQLEYCMIESCCCLDYLDVDKWAECDEKEAIMPYWKKVSDEAKKMAEWIADVETIVYANGDELSTDTMYNTLENAIKEQIGEAKYNDIKQRFDSSEFFVSFFEDDNLLNSKTLDYQDKCGIVYDINYSQIKEFFLKEFSFLANAIEENEDEKRERERNAVLQKVEAELQKLIMFRGTKEEIIEKLNAIRVNREESINLEPFEESLDDNDLGFNTNLGEIHEHYIDYEIYMLPTNKKDTFIITAVLAF